MPKLLQICTSLNSGSIGRIAEDINNIAQKKGWDCYIAYSRNMGNKSYSKLIKIGNYKSILWHILLTRFFDMHGYGSKISTKKLIKQIYKIKPDIINLHNLHGYYLNIEILFNYLAEVDIPIVLTLHDCWAFTGHCVHFDFVGCEKWKTGCYNCPQKKMYPTSYIIDNSKNNYLLKKKLFNSINNLTIVPVSKWLEKLVKQSFLNKHKIKQIYNGIDTETFVPVDTFNLRQSLNLIDKFIILGVASVWEERKGLNDFIKLTKLLDNTFKIVLIGFNRKQLKTIPKNILGIQRTEDVNELVEWYSTADVFINPTWEDNFPTTNLEAMACGTPVITYNTGGSPESVDKNTGIVVEKGDLQGLVNAIKIIKEKGKQSYSKACRDRVEKFYNKNDRFLDYINLYELMLKQTH